MPGCWNTGGGVAPTGVRGATLVGITMIRSNAEAFATTVARGPAMYRGSGPIRPFDLFLPEMVDNLYEDVVQGVLRLVSNHGGDLREVRNPARHVFEPRLVRFIVRNQFDRRLRAAELTDALG